MDILFKCPNCDQELEVDATGAGSSIECPACSRTITVPQSENQNGETAEAARTQPAGAQPKVEKHFSVPSHSGPTEALIQRANKPLEVAAKEGDRKVRVKTFKRTDCQEVGKDKFDETVSNFLDKVGWDNVISVNPVNYSYVQLDTHACVTDYGVLIVYRG